jgi:hypothetical protein
MRGVPVLALAAVVAGCANPGKLHVADPVPDDRNNIPEPKNRKIYIVADGFDQQFSRRAQRGFDLSRHLRSLASNPKQSFNVDAFDEVPNSSWFTNRNHMTEMSLEEIKRGPYTEDGPSLNGTWTVIGAKTEGVTPGFTIKDSDGNRYIIKFDPTDFPEMATGAEVVASKLFYAAGYFVPENYLVNFNPDIVKLGDGVTLKIGGVKRPMTQADLDGIFDRLAVRHDGTIRAVASKFLEGTLIGPFRYHGTRDDDPNDWVPHQHRRDLRGLKAIASWLNHYDTKANNSLDIYVEDNGRRYVRHYLIDFGSCLGSQGNEPMPQWVGYEYTVDTDQMLVNTMTMGLYVPRWEKDREVMYPAIGLYEAETYNPDEYKGITPNPAFVNQTGRDGFWGAKIVASFTDEQLQAAVESGEYSDPQAANYLTDVLKKRRDKVAEYWFDKMTPIDKFEVAGNELRGVDLAVKCGIASAAQRTYEYEILDDGGDGLQGPQQTGHPLRIALPKTADGVIQVMISSQREGGKLAHSVHAYLEPSGNGYKLIAVQRED